MAELTFPDYNFEVGDKDLIVGKPAFDWIGDAPKIEVMIYDDWIE